jgi:nicotinate-nucleotide--dimethylbenzimidazole phosphoribosyltransferase
VVIAALGGLEIGCLVGVILVAAAAHIPVAVDGFITATAALLAAGLAANIGPRLLAGHLSTEPGRRIALAAIVTRSTSRA